MRRRGGRSSNFDQIERLKQSIYDIELEDGDEIFIPMNPKTVQVIGAVFNQSTFVYQQGRDYSKYVDLCGGYSDSADTDNLYIIKVNGTAVRPQGSVFWDKVTHKWFLGSRDMDPGDTIVVPHKLTTIAWLRETKDLTQILYQVAVAAGVMLIAF